MKRLIPLVAVLFLLAGCTQGCGPGVENVPTPETEATPTPLASVRPTVALTPAPSAAPEPTPEPTPPPEPSEPVLVDPVPMPEETQVLPTPTPEQGGTAVPDDETVLAAYRQAVEVFGWFQMATLPADPADQVAVGEILYSRVDYPGLATLAELRGYLKNRFSDELVESLLPAGGTQYVDLNGALYVQEGARGADITKGGETAQVLRDGNPDRCTVQVTVEVLDPEQGFAVVGSETYDFPYEKVGDKWIFTSFSLVR